MNQPLFVVNVSFDHIVSLHGQSQNQETCMSAAVHAGAQFTTRFHSSGPVFLPLPSVASMHYWSSQTLQYGSVW